jgi:hypothetical protein
MAGWEKTAAPGAGVVQAKQYGNAKSSGWQAEHMVGATGWKAQGRRDGNTVSGVGVGISTPRDRRILSAVRSRQNERPTKQALSTAFHLSVARQDVGSTVCGHKNEKIGLHRNDHDQGSLAAK